MTISVDNLRSELLPGIDAKAAQSLEDAIRDFISARELALYRMMSFQLGWVDENGDRSNIPTRPRVHGQFALAIANAISDSDITDTVVPYAVSIELLHNYSLIHEDVEDGNTEHNGRPSVWWTWGPAQAINAGDGMHAMARMALFALSEKGEPVAAVSSSLRALDEAAVLMCEGEYTDIMMQEQLGLTAQKYIDMVSARSGSLFGAAGRIAASAAAKPELAETLFKFGQLVGTARQLSSDYTLFWGGKELDSVQQGRLLTKKKNLPVAHAIETAPLAVKRQLGDIYVQRVIDPAKVGDVTALVEQSGGKQFTLEAVKRTIAEASDTLNDSSFDEKTKTRLSELAMAVAGLKNSSGNSETGR